RLAMGEIPLPGLVALHPEGTEQNGADHVPAAHPRLALLFIFLVIGHRCLARWRGWDQVRQPARSSYSNISPVLALPHYGKDNRSHGAIQALQQPDSQQPTSEDRAGKVGAGQEYQP